MESRPDKMSTDVLIVGAGLAGCTLGYLLARAGRDVLAAELLDAKEKDKLCAGAISFPTLLQLEQEYGPDLSRSLELFKIRTWTSTNGEFTTSNKVEFFALPRKQLDDYCLRRYLEAGGRLVDRVRLDGIDRENRLATFHDMRSGEDFKVAYKTLVGADGAGSSVRRLLTGKKALSCPAFEGVVPRTRDDLVFGHYVFTNGYCWYIPRGADATVGVCVMDPDAQVEDCKARLEEFCGWLGIKLPALRGAPLPMVGDILLTPAKDCFLLGDAAGLIDHIGSGISFAVVSAHLLATALEKHPDDPQAAYEQSLAPRVEVLRQEAEELSKIYFVKYVNIFPRES